MINKNNRILYSLIAGISILCLFCIKNCFANPLDDWKNTKAYKPNPILFVHGFNANSSIWGPVIEGLSGYFSKYQVIGLFLETIDFPDNIGSIDSYPDGKRGCADDLKDKIETLFDRTKYGFYTTKLNLICHSMGGLAAREFLSNPKYPSGYVNKLVLIGVPNLGSPLAPAQRDMIRFYKVGSLVKLELFIISCNQRNTIDSFAEIVWIPGFDVSEAVKDMVPGSNFLNILNDRLQPAEVQYYGIYGIIGHLFNLFFFKDFYGGDGVISEKSQLGTGRVVFKGNPQKIKAFHNSEPAVSISGDNPLLKFLDSATPEFEITSPSPSQTTDLYVPSVNIQGKVYKEYLPADTQLIINITRQEDGVTLPTQMSFLKGSDLWIPNNPDSPVAEFDEPINFPGKGTYKISCQLKNPAGKTSDIKDIWVKVIVPVGTNIIVHCHNPEGKEIASIQGMSRYSVEIYDGDYRIGYGAYNAQTHGKPIELSPGTHTIKAKFNGMTKEQTITLNPAETKIVTFTFERALADINSLLSHSGSASRTNSAYHSGGGWGERSLVTWVDGDTEGGEGIYSDGCGHYRNNLYEPHTVYNKTEFSYNITPNSLYATGRTTLWSIPPYDLFIGAHQFGSGAYFTFYVNSIFTGNHSFDNWFIQNVLPPPDGYYITVWLQNSTDSATIIPWSSLGGYYLYQMNAVKWNKISIACGEIFNTRSGQTYLQKPIYTNELKISSVPYDLTGSAI